MSQRVLVVDDDAAILKAVKRALSGLATKSKLRAAVQHVWKC